MTSFVTSNDTIPTKHSVEPSFEITNEVFDSTLGFYTCELLFNSCDTSQLFINSSIQKHVYNISSRYSDYYYLPNSGSYVQASKKNSTNITIKVKLVKVAVSVDIFTTSNKKCKICKDIIRVSAESISHHGEAVDDEYKRMNCGLCNECYTIAKAFGQF